MEDAGSYCGHGVMVHHPLIEAIEGSLPGVSATWAQALEEM
jgi:hypothetical protein